MTILPIRPSVPCRLIEVLQTTGTGLTMALKPHLPDFYDEGPDLTDSVEKLGACFEFSYSLGRFRTFSR